MENTCEAAPKKQKKSKDEITAAAMEKYQSKLKKRVEEYTSMTSRLAVKGLHWSQTNAKEVLCAIACVLSNPVDVMSVRIYKSKAGADCFFGVAEFRSTDAAKAAFDSTEAMGFGDNGASFHLEVVPDAMVFEGPTDECCDAPPPPSKHGDGEQRDHDTLGADARGKVTKRTRPPKGLRKKRM